MRLQITNAHLQAKIDYLNKMTGSPHEPYTRDGEGKLCANIGNYHLDRAYGGVSLHRMCTDGGGVTDVFSCGHTTKRDLANRIEAYTQGIRAQKA